MSALAPTSTQSFSAPHTNFETVRVTTTDASSLLGKRQVCVYSLRPQIGAQYRSAIEALESCEDILKKERYDSKHAPLTAVNFAFSVALLTGFVVIIVASPASYSPLPQNFTDTRKRGGMEETRRAAPDKISRMCRMCRKKKDGF